MYRFYVQMQDATDRMSAVFGNDQASLLINTPAGAFNSPYNTSWNASGINPAFLPVFTDLADDTYATVGLDGPASTSGIAGAADPSVVEDENQPITPYFLTPGATQLSIDMLASFMAHCMIEELERVQHFLHFAGRVYFDVNTLTPLLVVNTIAVGKFGFVRWDSDQRRRLV